MVAPSKLSDRQAEYAHILWNALGASGTESIARAWQLRFAIVPACKRGAHPLIEQHLHRLPLARRRPQITRTALIDPTVCCKLLPGRRTMASGLLQSMRALSLQPCRTMQVCQLLEICSAGSQPPCVTRSSQCDKWHDGVQSKHICACRRSD